MGLQKSIVLIKAGATLKQLIKDKRLIFKGKDLITYTDKTGRVRDLSFDGMAGVFIDAAGVDYNSQAGVFIEDYKELLNKAYSKQEVK